MEIKMKKVFYINVKTNEVVEGTEVVIMTACPLKQVETAHGTMYVSTLTKFRNSKRELMEEEFADNFKILGMDRLMEKYKLNVFDANEYLEGALERFPEKFI